MTIFKTVRCLLMGVFTAPKESLKEKTQQRKRSYLDTGEGTGLQGGVLEEEVEGGVRRMSTREGGRGWGGEVGKRVGVVVGSEDGVGLSKGNLAPFIFEVRVISSPQCVCLSVSLCGFVWA